MNEQRRRLASHVTAHPGMHFNALVRDLDLAPGQVQYHIKRLLGSGRLVEGRFYGRTHYYPPSFGAWERGVLALARRETARDVLLSLLRDGEARPAAVADEIDIARSTLEYHLDHLVERGVVAKRRRAGNRVVLELRRPEATLSLLRHVEPPLPDRLVDRFMRLVDDLLED